MRKRKGIGRYRTEPLGPGPEADDSENRTEGGSSLLFSEPPAGGDGDHDFAAPPAYTKSPEPPDLLERFEEEYKDPFEEPEYDEPGFFRAFAGFLYAGSLVTFAGAVFFCMGYGWPYLQDHIRSLPGVEIVNDYRPDLGSQLLDNSEEPVAEFFENRRLRLASYEDLPEHLVQALIATEDQQFYRHNGVNPYRIVQSAIENARTGSRKGGSTVTQQLAKDLFTDNASTYKRKIREALYSLKMEQELSKEEILTIYLNQVDFGHNTRGIVGAAEFYFGKLPKDLNLAECATLVGILKANTRYSPKADPKRSKDRRGVVLKLMEGMGYITEEERIPAATEELVLVTKSTRGAPQLDRFPYWTAYVRDRLLRGDYGFLGLPPTNDPISLDSDSLYTGGHKIKTTLDPAMQRWGTQALRNALVGQERIRRKQPPGWGKPAELRPRYSNRIYPNAKLLGRITGFEDPHWLTVKLSGVAGEPVVAVQHPGAGDWRSKFGVLEAGYFVPVVAAERTPAASSGYVAKPEQDLIDRGLVTDQQLRFRLRDQYRDQHAEGALVCLEVGTGRVLSWVGGYDWRMELSNARRNRVVEMVQPGSSFKPIVYAAAFENGYKPLDKISNETYVHYSPYGGEPWKPSNYNKEKVGGFYPLRTALIMSLNIPTVRVFETLVGNVYKYDAVHGAPSLEIARRLGVRSHIPKELSVSLGSADVTPLEMATAYSVFANEGVLVEPYAIESIESRDGESKYIHLARGNREALSPVIAYLLTDSLTGVLREPPGTGYRLAQNFPYPVAGKTGTTNMYYDSWFVGYSKNLVTGVWIGHDSRNTLGHKRSGGRVALPPWLDFMKRAIPYHAEKSLGIGGDLLASASGDATSPEHPLAFERPDGMARVEVCKFSLRKPNAFCKTRKVWFGKGNEPNGFCQACGIAYDRVPVAGVRPSYPSQSSGYPAARPRPVRRLNPIGSNPPPEPPGFNPSESTPRIRTAEELEEARRRGQTGPGAAVPRPIPRLPAPLPESR